MSISKLSKIMVAKLSLATIASTIFFTYQNYLPLRRVVNNVFYDDIQVENKFYNDPNGLYVNTEINDNGNKEVYLKHGSEEWEKKPILYDGFYDTESMLECIAKRSESLHNKNNWDKKRYLKLVDSIEDNLYRSIE